MGPNRIPRRDWLLGTSASLLALGAASTAAAALGQPGTPSLRPQGASDAEDADRVRRMKWWHEARFGMFIHWGLYAIPARGWNGKQIPGIGEWIMNRATIPVADYKALAPNLNPTQFNAAAIVGLAKAAEMKDIVITSEHHHGFAIFDSKADGFNIVQATPFKRDPLKELAAECRAQGIRLGFYYWQDQDWTAPAGIAYRTGDHKPPTFHWDPAQDGNLAQYLEIKAIPQVKELLSNYGEFPAIIWFDTLGCGRQIPCRWTVRIV